MKMNDKADLVNTLRYLPFVVPCDSRTLLRQMYGSADAHSVILNFFAQLYVSSYKKINK